MHGKPLSTIRRPLIHFHSYYIGYIIYLDLAILSVIISFSRQIKCQLSGYYVKTCNKGAAMQVEAAPSIPPGLQAERCFRREPYLSCMNQWFNRCKNDKLIIFFTYLMK